jgi:hypothetical protein
MKFLHMDEMIYFQDFISFYQETVDYDDDDC